MNELFGLSMTVIAIVLGSILGLALVTVGVIGVANRTMFKFGLRNIPRRGLQSLLVVTGLALATLITTAAFVTGDTVDQSLTADSERLFGASDIDLVWTGERAWEDDGGVPSSGEPVFVNANVVDELEQAFAGDESITGFLPWLTLPSPVTNLRTGDARPAIQLTGADASRLDAAGGLTLTNGSRVNIGGLGPNEVYLSERAANELRAELGDTLHLHIGSEPTAVTVVGIVRDEIASGVLGMSYASAPGGLVLPAETLRTLAGLENNEITSLTVALDPAQRDEFTLGEPAAERLNAYLEGEGATLFTATGGLEASRVVEAFASRQAGIESAQQTGSVFTTIFLVLGLFSMAAGVMLIFMIFVMLAAERRAEMGMARAVGAQRRHLIQSFLAEGMAYSLLAGVIGVGAGILSAWALMDLMLKRVGGDYFSLIQMEYTPRSIFVGYALGVVVTFITVIFASMKASHVNIVSAIRQLPDSRARELRRKTRWKWVAIGVLTLPIVPVGLWLLLRKGFGLPWGWITGPLGVAAGALFMLLGSSSEVLFFFALGISLIPLSLAGMARYFGVPARGLWTAVGAVLAAYWLMPDSLHTRLFGDFSSDMEMFVLSGIMIVVSFTLIIVFNARLLTRLFNSGEGVGAYRVAIVLGAIAAGAAIAGSALADSGDGLGELLYLLAGIIVPTALLSAAAARITQIAPALKMAVAYPLANRFRTGMTIAMFSLIVFSLTVFSVILANFQTAFAGADARGNLDLVVTANQGSDVSDVASALAESGSPVAGQVAATGGVTITSGPQAVSQEGVDNEGFYPVIGANDGFLSSLEASLDATAAGYGTAAEVMEAVRNDPSLALADNSVIGIDFNGSYDWSAEGAELDNNVFQPITVTLRDAARGTETTVTIVGILKVSLPKATMAGIYVNEEAYTALLGTPNYLRTYIRLDEGVDSREAARQIESSLAVRGVEAESVEKIIDDLGAANTAFNRMFQAFMALGLLVGIAGLGVIAFRSVVERRQQIGMLRAIGYQRGIVTLTFLFESSFVAVMGILSGVIGGAILGRNLLMSDTFTEGADITFTMPWAEIVMVIGASFIFSLMMTWWPSRGASRVPVAEALRYE